jgi:hypothetical protein
LSYFYLCNSLWKLQNIHNQNVDTIFFTGNSIEVKLTKCGLGYILGDFLQNHLVTLREGERERERERERKCIICLNCNWLFVSVNCNWLFLIKNGVYECMHSYVMLHSEIN